MKSSELSTGIAYGVIPSWQYSSRSARDPLQTSRNNVSKATLVNMDRYKYDVYRSGAVDDVNFEKVTDPKDRRFGYLVTDGNIYWVARPQDFVDVWVTLEKRWAIEEEAHRQAMAAQQAAQERDRALVEEADKYSEHLRQTLIPILYNITGRTESIILSRSNYDAGKRVNPFIMVQMDARILERLVERVLEAQEA